jgi:dUTP pyrophosphatase
MSLQVTRLVDNAILPTRGSPGAAGLDLYSADGYVVMPGHRVVVSTGISVKLPVGTYGRVAPRSGLAVKHGLDILAGVIDPDYTGELKVVLVNTDMRVPFFIKPGYRIAQLIMECYVPVTVEEVFEPGEITDRGAAGFGSTGLEPTPSSYKVTGV